LEGSTLNPFSQPHRLGITYQKKWDFLTATLQYTYANGRPFTQAAEIFTVTTDNGETYPAIDFEDLLAERVEDYHRVDLSFNSSFKTDRTLHSFGLQINNLFDRDNTIKNQYFIDYTVDPRQLGFLSKGGVPLSFNLFWEMTIN